MRWPKVEPNHPLYSIWYGVHNNTHIYDPVELAALDAACCFDNEDVLTLREVAGAFEYRGGLTGANDVLREIADRIEALLPPLEPPGG